MAEVTVDAPALTLTGKLKYDCPDKYDSTEEFLDDVFANTNISFDAVPAVEGAAGSDGNDGTSWVTEEKTFAISRGTYSLNTGEDLTGWIPTLVADSSVDLEIPDNIIALGPVSNQRIYFRFASGIDEVPVDGYSVILRRPKQE